MDARLIVVSNRVAVPETPRSSTAAGSAVAVKAALKHRNAVWFGWSGDVVEAAKAETRTVRVNKVDYVVFDLTSVDIQEYYSGFAKKVLWPILHYRVDLQQYSRLDAGGYLRVNRLFGDRLNSILEPEDIVWVQDYHLMPLARDLRARGARNAIGFFLHTPFSPPDVVHAMPSHSQILDSLSYYDLIGFQTENDRDNFERYIVSEGAELARDGSIQMDERRVRLGVFPVGIETAAFRRLARIEEYSPTVRGLRSSLGESRLILGVDRIDCSKGVVHRMKAFERFLELYPAWRDKATLLQVTPTRAVDDNNCENEAELESLITRINGRFGDAAWTPIRYVHHSYPRSALAGIARLADAALVTPLRAGMNLVAKEFVAAQDPEDPGVLVLSQFAGAANELDRALIVNPHEIDGVAAALKRALEMPLPERRERHAAMLGRLLDWDIGDWAESYLSALVETQSGRGILDDIRSFFGTFGDQRSSRRSSSEPSREEAPSNALLRA